MSSTLRYLFKIVASVKKKKKTCLTNYRFLSFLSNIFSQADGFHQNNLSITSVDEMFAYMIHPILQTLLSSEIFGMFCLVYIGMSEYWQSIESACG